MRIVKRIILLSVILFIVSGCESMTYQIDEEIVESKVMANGESQDGGIRYVLGDDVSETGAYSNQYYIDHKVKYNRKHLKGTGQDKYTENDLEYYDVNIYDFKTKKKVKTIDVIKEAPKYVDMDKYQFSFNRGNRMVKKNGHYCIVVKIEKIPNKEEMELGRSTYQYDLFLGIDGYGYFSKDKFKNTGLGIVGKKEYMILDNHQVKQQNIPNELDGSLSLLFGFDPYWDNTSEEGICQIWLSIRSLKIMKNKDIRLYREFPEIKTYIENNESEEELVIYVKGRNWSEVLQLLMPEGKEVELNNIELSGDGTLDGKDHIVNSEEEYYKYNKWLEHQ